MKVLMIAPQPFFEPRGTPISVFQRLHGVSALGHEVHLVTYHVGKNVDIPNIKIYRTPAVPFIKKVKVGPSLAKIPLDILIFFMSVWMLLRHRYDVIHSHEEASFFAVILSFIFRTPHLYDMHSSLPKQLDNYKFGNYKPIIKVFEWLENGVISTADVILTIGLDLEEHALKVKPNANHIRIENTALHNIISVDKQAAADLRRSLNIKDDQLAVVYTGTFERYQGLDLLLDSIALVKADHPEVVPVMVGGKPEQVEQWQQEAKQRGLSVIFTGTVPLEDSLLYLELADVLVSPRSQGLSVPLKIYTYMHSGKPILATNIPAHTLVLDELCAVLTEPEAQAYANGLRRLLDNPDLRTATGTAGKARAEQVFSRAQYLEKIESAYRSIELATPIQYLPIKQSTKG